MFQEIGIFKTIIAISSPLNSLTIFFTNSSDKYPVIKYIPLYYVISAKTTIRSVFIQYMAYFYIFTSMLLIKYWEKTKLVY
jgi:hypothetical protein